MELQKLNQTLIKDFILRQILEMPLLLETVLGRNAKTVTKETVFKVGISAANART